MRHAVTRRWRAAILLAMLVALGGCETRSISNSGYQAPGWGRSAGGNPFYRGELTEFDVLGIDTARVPDDAEIARALDDRRKPTLRKGAAILLIQSGAPIPDAPMIAALDRRFTVVPFSGVPLGGGRVAPGAASSAPAAEPDAASYARSLRLAAARAGAETVLCYWGILESAVEREATKTVSWVPIVGSVIPDETQHMRIRLKVAVIDVRSGAWSMFAPEPFVDARLSASLNRAGADQGQVELLKGEAYQAAADAFMAKYTD